MANPVGRPPLTPEAWVQSPQSAAEMIRLFGINVLIFQFNAFQVPKALVAIKCEQNFGWGTCHCSDESKQRGSGNLIGSMVTGRVTISCYPWAAGDQQGGRQGESPCRLSILRNANVTCLCRLFMPMSHVKFKKSLGYVTCHYNLYPPVTCH